jgi:hypothetical protein
LNGIPFEPKVVSICHARECTAYPLSDLYRIPASCFTGKAMERVTSKQ